MWLFNGSRHENEGPVVVEQPRSTTRAGRHRATGLVDGFGVWFESADVRLAAAPEAFGAAFLVPALHVGRPLYLAPPVCATWLENLRRLEAEFRRLWYPEAARAVALPVDRQTEAVSGTALCFSGGVDAFHALFTSGRSIDTLVGIGGFDFKLRDRSRAAALDALVRTVAAAAGTRAVFVRTNVKRHPLLRHMPWLRAFAGPLAAVGHVLANTVGRLVVAGDGLGFVHAEVGSRPDTDPLHGSAALAIEHHAAGVTRLEKVRAIAGEPLVQAHLRVCWQNVPGRINCGRCEKCLRTMLELEACGHLGRFAGFDHGRGLGAALDALPSINDIDTEFYRDALAAGLPAPAAAATRRLLDRSHVASRPKLAVVGGPRRPPARHRLLDPAAFAPVFEPLVGRFVGYVKAVGNVGDHLIELAMTQLLDAYGIRWSLWDPEAPAEHDLLAFGGGGSMGDRYPVNHAIRGRALATGLPVVILPQSFTAREDRPFHRVYVRERRSLELRPDATLAPDLALGLRWPDPPAPRHDLGVFLRRDCERVGPKPMFVRDPIAPCRNPADYLALAARHRQIVTDRLHFAIAGLHAGREVTLLPCDYFKNHAMHETWLADLGCRFAGTVAEAIGQRRRAA
jgi:hypothetical protein